MEQAPETGVPESLYRRAFEASPVAMAMLDERGIMVSVNEALCRLLNRPKQELEGSSALPFTHPDDRVPHSAYLEIVDRAEDSVLSIEKRYVRPNGEVRWGWLTATRVPGPHGREWTFAHIQDITERKEAERQLRDSETNLAAVALVTRRIRTGEAAREGIVTAARDVAEAATAVLLEVDNDDLVITASVGLENLLGTRIARDSRSINAEVSRTGVPLFVADPESHPQVSAHLLALSGAASMLSQPLIVRGRITGVLAVTWNHKVQGTGDRVARAVGLLADEAALALEHEGLLQELEERATTDPLTGLPNRRAWDTALDTMLSASRLTGRPVTVALADLDRFKQFNDVHGHPAGDELLRIFGTLGSAVMRGGDLLARWGGEEFAVALPHVDAVAARVVLDRLRTVLPSGQTCSIGVAEWDGFESAVDLLQRADTALYEAKSTGRDRIVQALLPGREEPAVHIASQRRPDAGASVGSPVIT